MRCFSYVNFRLLLFALLCLVVGLAHASLLTRGEWEDNANVIIQLHETNRDDGKFIVQFMSHIMALYSDAEKIDREERRGDRTDVARRYILMHLNARLLFQYAVDHKESVGQETIITCRDFAQTTRNALMRKNIPIEIVARELPNFRRSFGDSPFRLRSL